MVELVARVGLDMGRLPLPPLPLFALNGEWDYAKHAYERDRIALSYENSEYQGQSERVFSGRFEYTNEDKNEPDEDFEGDVGIDAPDTIEGVLTGLSYKYAEDDGSEASIMVVLADFEISGMALDAADYARVAGDLDAGFARDGYKLASLIFRKDDAITGSGGDDDLRGFGGNDTIDAGLGNDVLAGGTGRDVLAGGLGKDTFVFDVALGAKNIDAIVDFRHSKDTMTLEAGVFKGLDAGELPEGRLKEIADPQSGKGVDKSDRILYDKQDGDLYFDRDGSKTKYDPVRFAEVKDRTYLEADDFLIV